MENELIPKQCKGGQMDAVANCSLNSATEAVSFFEVVKNRLLNVNDWDEVCQAPSSTFRLLNAKNQRLERLAQVGDFIRINIPGPGTKLGKGFDWVTIESIDERFLPDGELLSMTVRPCSHPLHPDGITAHFFSASATSTFQVRRLNDSVSAAVHGRNELANTHFGNVFDKIRNWMVAFGAKLGFSYPQWKLLVEGLIRQR